MTVELSRPWRADSPLEAAEVAVTADAAERMAVAARLGLDEVAELSCRFRLSRVPGAFGRIAAEGLLRARLARICVVTLEPFMEALDERFRVVFVPEGTESGDDDPEADDEIPYAGSAIDLGEAAVEQLALTMAAYPRRPGLPPPGDDEEQSPASAGSPFAALARMRPPG